LPLLDTQSFGTAFGSIYDRDPLLHLGVADDAAFISLLRDLHRRKLPSKNENFLFSPAHFDPDRAGVDTRRGLANVRHVRGIWLDNDGGDLSHKEFARLFPALRVVAWNTYSSTQKTTRWRCFMPTTQAVNPDQYKAIIEQIMQVLRYAGYISDAEQAKRPSLKVHGFDTSKFVSSSLFYAPCQAEETGASFFVDYDDADRAAIDPNLWLENDIRNVAIPAPEPEHSQETIFSADNAQAIQAATERWRNIPRGQGNRAFYRFAQDLRRAGLNKTEIRTRLNQEAAFGASPKERLADARRMVRWLK
jgi:hypothetical protein